MDGLSKYILARRFVRCSSSYHIFNSVTCDEDLYMPSHIRTNHGLLFRLCICNIFIAFVIMSLMILSIFLFGSLLCL